MNMFNEGFEKTAGVVSRVKKTWNAPERLRSLARKIEKKVIARKAQSLGKELELNAKRLNRANNTSLKGIKDYANLGKFKGRSDLLSIQAKSYKDRADKAEKIRKATKLLGLGGLVAGTGLAASKVRKSYKNNKLDKD